MTSVFRSRLWLVAAAVGMLLVVGCSGDSPTDPGVSPEKKGGPPVGTGDIRLSPNLSFVSWTVIELAPGGEEYYGWGPDTIEDVPVGTYQVIWGDVGGILPKPATERGRLKNNQTLIFETVYHIATASEDPPTADLKSRYGIEGDPPRHGANKPIEKSKWGMDGPPKYGANRPDVK